MPADICMHPWAYAVEPFRIAGNLYYVGNSNVSCHLIDTADGLLLLDTAYPQTVYLLLESIRRLSLDPDDIRLILHCHGHYDHIGGTRAMVELTGARTALGTADIEILEHRPELSWAPQYGVPFYESFAVDRPLHDGDRIVLGESAVECVAVPGHTPGAMAFFFEVIEGGHAYTVGMHGGPGLNTLSDEYLRQYGLPCSRREDYLRSLEKLRVRQVDIFIGAHPGQNDTLNKRAAMEPGHNPFIDARAWPSYIQTLGERAREAFGL